MDKVKVFAPASVANIGCGYDTIGFAVQDIGEYVTLSKRHDNLLVVKGIIGAELSKRPEENVATIGGQCRGHNDGVGFGFSRKATSLQLHLQVHLLILRVHDGGDS